VFGAAFGCGYPGAESPRWIVANVLGVAALQIGDPIALFVGVKPSDFLANHFLNFFSVLRVLLFQCFQPIFQNRFVGWGDFVEGNAHAHIGLRIYDASHGVKDLLIGGDLDDYGSAEGIRVQHVHIAAVTAKIAGARVQFDLSGNLHNLSCGEEGKTLAATQRLFHLV
jgi:hypothetical protein